MDTTQKVYDAIVDEAAAGFYAVTVHDIMARTGITSTNLVAYHLAKLEASGRIRRRGDGRTGIQVMPESTLIQRIWHRLRA